MAFPLINYASPELQKSPLNDMISNALSGYQGMTQARYMQPTLAEALQHAQLQNQYYGPNIESEMALRKAQTGEAGARTGLLGAQTRGVNIENESLPNFLRQALAKQKDEAEKRQFEKQYPMFGYPGMAGQIAALDYMQKNPDKFNNINSISELSNPNSSSVSSVNNNSDSDRSLADALRKSITQGTPKQQNIALEKHRERMDNMALWNSLPPTAKTHAIAIGQGAGFSADETARWLGEGKDMKSLLYQHGITDESQVEPVYQLTTAAQTQLLQRLYASKEADYLGKFIKDNTGEYAKTVAGYNPKLIKDQLAGKNEEQQAKFLAARGLSPEIVNLRLLIANAKSSVYAQKSLSEKAMLDIKNIRSLVSEKVWTRTQEIMDETIQNMFKQAKTKFGQKVNWNNNGLGQKISQKLPSGNQENDPLGIR